ncbi:uncharacterized protein LOC130552817 isoform X2 [Triplophysa rosa]|uniref:uncharacterized protein LOC130552817 isoform X2 n=1 Tax=Triplophysa rosa TaxID=992332 RepID=UPI002545E279|nr:uncharacterized protein LOC130552817 isoform X2 [Triplophysa rosa]
MFSKPRCETTSSITTGPLSPCPGSDRSPRSLLGRPRRLRIYDNSKQRRIEKWEMLLEKRPLRVQSARCSRRTENKLNGVSTSQQYFKLDVPKWSDYFPTPSDKKKMASPVDPRSSSEVKPVPAQKRGHVVKFCFVPAPIVVSDRSSSLVDIPVGMPVVRTLVIGDSTLKRVQVETPGTMVNCIRGARASDIKSKLNVLANNKRRFNRIIIQVGINEVQLRQSEISKINIKEVCDLAKTMSDTVICSGPIPSYWGDELYSRLSALHDWMCEWCPQNNLGFIDNWKYFCMRPDLFWEDGLYPNSDGTAILSKNLTDSINSADV